MVPMDIEEHAFPHPVPPTGGRRALVVGLGVSGIATAVRLRSIGWDPVIVEKSPGRRTGGYFVGIFGAGQAAARRLGILDAIPDRSPANSADYVVTRSGNRRSGLGFTDFPSEPRVMSRGDVEQGVFAALPDDVEIRYSTSPVHIEQDTDGVDVTLERDGTTGTERFDLVVGADGLRSTVRRLVFAPHEQHLHRLGYMIAAFTLPGPIGGMAANEGAMLLEPGRSLLVLPFAGRGPSAFFSYRTSDVESQFSGRPVDRLRTAYRPEPYGRLLGEALDAFEATDEYLYDTAEQVQMSRWSKGRVVLTGDAAWCTTVYSGMGASAALAGADLLGTMLRRHGDRIGPALRAWESHLRPPIASYQRTGIAQVSLFTPSSRRQMVGRRIFEFVDRLPVLGAALRHRLDNSEDNVEKERDIAFVA
ncbi:2-polyprenyl-6-methoxyphenol hydroxylase-like FAD-dependent oxidoreductase [Pseudonocardia autotrophica]|uniref:6-hydroxynicotinate 3-monooxygenase n=3 Tax=Pseudonocardiaceae TaxID=2070 RepID=A0A1Y2MHM8_PSEAH|nr:6-hydroxynicotinate 3-monooxygenase precursor [Pseudonocardia autotrophica]TDN76101.1 2-polyprenyl-6-methoxyphenol hydroxylase-like FAD-dependent oxidoreductase [Pseudonocardia autotrophica]